MHAGDNASCLAGVHGQEAHGDVEQEEEVHAPIDEDQRLEERGRVGKEGQLVCVRGVREAVTRVSIAEAAAAAKAAAAA